MADDIEAALYTRLQAVSALTALVSTRIYKNRLPEGAARPCIVYQRISATRERVLSGPLYGCTPRYQFDVFANTRDSMEAVRKQLRLALDGYSGTSASVAIHSSWLINDFDEYDAEVEQFRASLDFEVTFLETT